MLYSVLKMLNTLDDLTSMRYKSINMHIVINIYIHKLIY